MLCTSRGLPLTGPLAENGQVETGFLTDLIQLTCSAAVEEQVPAKLCAHAEAKSCCGKRILVNRNYLGQLILAQSYS